MLQIIYSSLPRIIPAVFLVLAALKFFRPESAKKINFIKLIYWYAGFLAVWALFQTWALQSAWGSSSITRYLLTAPVSGDVPWWILAIFSHKGGYFIFYALSRFWATPILSFFSAWVFYRFLIVLKKKRERFFEEGEVELGFLAAFLCGWPGVVAFVVLVFSSVVIISLIRGIFFKEIYTTLGPAFLLGAALFILFSPYFSRFFSLSVLRF